MFRIPAPADPAATAHPADLDPRHRLLLTVTANSVLDLYGTPGAQILAGRLATPALLASAASRTATARVGRALPVVRVLAVTIVS
jgi:hypothetical protein